jgi:hypothetical protein
MSIVRIKHNRENPFVQLNKKALWDQDLPLEAVGLWARCLSKPDDWEFNTTHLARTCGVNIETLKKYINILIKNNYALRFQKRQNAGGRQLFEGYVYVFFEFKLTDQEKADYIEEFKKCFPQSAFSTTEASTSETYPPTNTEEETKEREESNISLVEAVSEKFKREPSAPSADASELTDFFLSKIREKKKDLLLKNKSKWIKDFDLMTRVDKRSVDEIKRIISWLVHESNQLSYCMSPDKLRRRFDEFSVRIQEKAGSDLVRRNREYALQVKEKYPEKVKGLTYNAEYVLNPKLSKEVPFSLPHDTFKDAFYHLFCGEEVSG